MSKRGFASLSPDHVRQIARMGGRAAQASGKAHRWTREEAQAAGRKGREACRAKYGKEYFSQIGSAGGKASKQSTESKS
jgi:general stress protein YciG